MLPVSSYIKIYFCELYHVVCLCFGSVNLKPTPPSPNLFTFKTSSCHAVTLPVLDMQATLQLINVTIVIIYFLYYLLLIFCGSVRYVKFSSNLTLLYKHHPNHSISINESIYIYCFYSSKCFAILDVIFDVLFKYAPNDIRNCAEYFLDKYLPPIDICCSTHNSSSRKWLCRNVSNIYIYIYIHTHIYIYIYAPCLFLLIHLHHSSLSWSSLMITP